MAIEAHSDRVALQVQLEALERRPPKPRWAWIVVALGLVAVLALGYHGSTAYATVASIDARSKIETRNPAALFQDVATNGPQVGSAVDNSSRATYSKALEQFVLDGTGLLIGIVLMISGLFIRINR